MARKDKDQAEQNESGAFPEIGPEFEAIQAALQAFGIPEEFVMLARRDPESGRVTVVTHGGKKVVWSGEGEVQPLTQIEITGINPENAKRRPLTGVRK